MTIVPGPTKEALTRDWNRWLRRRPEARTWLYHVTESVAVPRIRRSGFRLSTSTDLGRGVYLFGPIRAVYEWMDEREYADPVILKIRRPRFALHATEVFRRGLVHTEPRPSWSRLDAMWIVRQPGWKPDFRVLLPNRETP